MRAVIQRVSKASVSVNGEISGSIGAGLLVLLGVGKADKEEDADYLLNKIVNLRIFSDPAGKFNHSLLDVGGELLVVSQFTLYGSVSGSGRRPSFDRAAPPDEARRLYEYFLEKARTILGKVEAGVFQAAMKVELVNEGPVTILADSERQL